MRWLAVLHWCWKRRSRHRCFKVLKMKRDFSCGWSKSLVFIFKGVSNHLDALAPPENHYSTRNLRRPCCHRRDAFLVLFVRWNYSAPTLAGFFVTSNTRCTQGYSTISFWKLLPAIHRVVDVGEQNLQSSDSGRATPTKTHQHDNC